MLLPTVKDIGFAVQALWAADQGPARPLSRVTKGIVHFTQGGLGGDKYVLTSADLPVESCHALIAKDGTTFYSVPIGITAWTPGNDDFAEQSINVELSGYMDDGATDAQYVAMANFFAWCIRQGCPIPVKYIGRSGQPGFLGHVDVPNPYGPGYGGASGHTDPGPKFDWPRFIGLVQSALSLGAVKQVDAIQSQPDVIFIKETGKQIGFGFKNFWLGLDRLGDNYRLLTLGLPVTNEFDIVFAADAAAGKKHTVQLFERGGLIHEDNPAPWDNHPMTVGQLFEAYRYATSNGLLSDPAQVTQDRRVFDLTDWAERLDATFASYSKDGQWTSAEFTAFANLIKGMRSGQSYSQYTANTK